MSKSLKNLSKSEIKKYKTLIKFIVYIYPGLAKVQLAKLLFAIDKSYYAKYKKTITGDNYIKNLHGPTPCNYDAIRKELVENREISEIHKQIYDFSEHQHYPCNDINYEEVNKNLNSEEVLIIKNHSDVIKKTARSLSNETHQSVYHALEMGDHIPDYMLPYYYDKKINEIDLQWAAKRNDGQV